MSARALVAALERGVLERFGLVFSAARGEAFVRGVQRVATNLTGGSLSMLLAKLQQEDPEVVSALAEALTISETYFFRDEQSFVVVDRAVERALASGRGLRIWSAGCSTGEEAYSLAIRALESAGGVPLAIDVLGTDLSKRALAQAEEAVYRPWSFRGVSAEREERWFEHVAGTELRRPIAEVRRLVRFRQANLLDGRAAPSGVDLVFCRNVFIYFEASAIEAAVRTLIATLAADGTMVLGPSDPLVHDERLRIDQEGGFVSYSRVPAHEADRSRAAARGAPTTTRPPSRTAVRSPARVASRAPRPPAPAPTAVVSRRPEEVVARARELADRGELVGARTLLEGAGDDDAALLLRAFVARSLGDSESALRDVRALTAKASPPVLAHLLDAMVSVDVADVDGARAAITLARGKLGALPPHADIGDGTAVADAGATLLALEKRLNPRTQRRRRRKP